MFSSKSDLYKSMESEIVLDMHKVGVKNLKINLKLRYVLIILILISTLSP